MLLAGIMLKLGIYGFLKINYFIFYKAIIFIFPYIATQAIVSSFISSFVIYKQVDIKKIIAYSSIIHMNIGVIAFFSSSAKAIVGAMLLVFSHGLASSGLFLCVGILQNYLKERNILQVTGLLRVSPY
jgi:NADH:ubiquinone oxidoreductase subunit 4 (subunit M)